MKELIIYKNNSPYIMLYDDEDEIFLKQFSISLGGDGYAVTKIKGKVKRIHRLLLGEENPKIIIDHINRNILDNRKNNLRRADKSKNALNEKPIRKNNCSGVKGVYWDKINNKWVSSIMLNHKGIKIGRYNDKEEAIKMRLEAELFLCGNKYSSQRDLFNKYDVKNFNNLPLRVIKCMEELKKEIYIP